jgi:hypothetical protein
MTDLPTGYRWATAEETEAHAVTANPAMVVVPRTADASGTPYTHGEADLALPIDLPRSEHGDIDCSASYGEFWFVKIQWSTDSENRVIAEDDEKTFNESVTFHGPFFSPQEAADWCNAYPEDTDIHDMYVWNMNGVRPSGLPAITATTVSRAEGEAAARADLGLGKSA